VGGKAEVTGLRLPGAGRGCTREAAKNKAPATDVADALSKTCQFITDRPQPESASVVLNNQVNFALHWDLGANWLTSQNGRELLELNVEVARNSRKNVAVCACSSNLVRGCSLHLWLDLNGLARLYLERWAVNELAVNEDVAVNHSLASLKDGASKASAQNEGVETRLEELDHGLTSQTVKTTGLVVSSAELLLTKRVLCAKTLLLAQTNCVVGLGAATATAVLTWWVWTLLKVLNSLWGKSNAQCAAQANLAARTGYRRHAFSVPVVVC